MKRILNLLLVIGACNGCLAQINKQMNKVSLGIRAGLSYSNIYGKDVDYVFAENATSYRPGYHVGLIVENKISEHFSLKHELFFNHNVTRVQLSDSINGQFSSSIKTNYLVLFPGNATLHVNGFQVSAGPYISALTGAQIKRKDEEGNTFIDRGIYGKPDNDESERKYLQKFDFGINVGMSYQIQKRISIDVRYMHGLTDIFQYANSYTQNSGKKDAIRVFNRSFILSMGLSIL